MDRMTELHYVIGGSTQFGRLNLGRAATAVAAVKKARELLQEGHLDVGVHARGRILLSDEFDQLQG
jgi:hypothetical protein